MISDSPSRTILTIRVPRHDESVRTTFPSDLSFGDALASSVLPQSQADLASQASAVMVLDATMHPRKKLGSFEDCRQISLFKLGFFPSACVDLVFEGDEVEDALFAVTIKPLATPLDLFQVPYLR